MKNEFNLSAYILLIVGVITIGFTAIFVKWADAPGTVTAFYRMAIASIAMAIPFLYHLRQTAWRLPRSGVLFAIGGGLCFGTDIAFWMTGVMMGEATTPTLMANTAPVWVGLISWLFLKEKQKSLFWMGIVLAFAGAALILGVNFTQSFHIGLGAIFGLIASFLYAGFHLFSQRGRQQLGTIAYFWLFTTSGAIILLILNLILGRSLWGYDSNTNLNFLLIGLVGHVGGWLCINYSQGHLPASLIAPSVLGQPVVTGILAVVLLGDAFSIYQILGGIAVLVGIWIVHQSHSTNEG